MKNVIRRIQNGLNRCINLDLKAVKDSLSLKLHYLDQGQKILFLHQELFRVTDILVQLRKNKIIDSLFNYTDNLDFLWESTFIEHLTPDEKKKYRNFDLSSFHTNQHEFQNHIYDEKLPYYSQTVQFVVFSKYIHLLKKELEYYQTLNSPDEKKLKLPREKPANQKTFESNFDIQQIEILTCCINEARIFTESVSSDTVSRIFNCQLNNSLRVKNNRLLAYFFVSLDDRSLITHYWQSVCAENQLFLSSLKGNILKKTDLSTATNECRDFPPKDSEIIDKYIKELKKH
jgi:hypothetical protein